MRIIQVSKHFTRVEAELVRCDPEELVLMLDADRCISCGACQLACQLENGAPGQPAPVRRLLAVNRGGRQQERVVNLPLSCRSCTSPCAYFTPYNYWTTCPLDHRPVQPLAICDQCGARAAEGYMPACATRCTMKCIYFGKARDIAFALGEKRLREMGDVEFNP